MNGDILYCKGLEVFRQEILINLCFIFATFINVCFKFLACILSVVQYFTICYKVFCINRAEETTFDKKEKERFDEFCSAYAHSLIPYINKCLQALYPQTQLAQILGVTVSELQKMVHLFVLLIVDSCM